MDVVHPAQLKANSRQKKQKLLTGFDSGENYRVSVQSNRVWNQFQFRTKGGKGYAHS